MLSRNRLTWLLPLLFAARTQLSCGDNLSAGTGGGLERPPITCSAPLRGQIPLSLTQSGCFDPIDASVPNTRMLDYNIAMPLWADRAGKHRLLSIPPDTAITVQDDGNFVFPIGSVLAKTFFRTGAAIETRLLVRHADGQWAGYAYEWNPEQNDAVLLDGAKEIDGDWRIPSPEDCMQCHTKAAGYTLGPQVAQMNTVQFYPQTGRLANQLLTLATVGMLVGLPSGDPAVLPAFPRLGDVNADRDTWARAYLHTNCGHCHRPGGPPDAHGDLRAQTPLAQTGMCNQEPEFGDLGVSGALQLAPGEPNLSLLTLRMLHLGDHRMPPLSSREIHSDAVSRLQAWLGSLTDCQ